MGGEGEVGGRLQKVETGHVCKPCAAKAACARACLPCHSRWLQISSLHSCPQITLFLCRALLSCPAVLQQLEADGRIMMDGGDFYLSY